MPKLGSTVLARTPRTIRLIKRSDMQSEHPVRAAIIAINRAPQKKKSNVTQQRLHQLEVTNRLDAASLLFARTRRGH
jgi:hypothetical protein